MFRFKKLSLVAGALLTSLGHADFAREPLKDPGPECANYDSEGWLTIYDGSQASAEKYWWISNASHGDGGHWWVDEDPASVAAGKLKAGQKVLWSNQNPNGNGGLLYTQRRYKDVEVKISIFPGWENDGGLFMRSNGKGQAWQVMIDYQPGKTVGGIWPEGLTGPSQDFIALATETKIDARLAKWNMADWPKIWDVDGYNVIEAKIVNDPGYITAFITDSLHPVTDYQTTAQPGIITETGYIGLQIHASVGEWKGGPNKYQWMKVRELVPGTHKPLCPATATQIVETKKESLKTAWSNDGSGNLRVTGMVADDYEMSLSGMDGRVLERRVGRSGAVTQEFPGLAKGIYFVNISTPKSNQSYKAVRL